MKERLIARDIDRIEDIMADLEYDKETRDKCWKWLRNIRDDITSFLKEYEYETDNA
jgi:hypothetical protein